MVSGKPIQANYSFDLQDVKGLTTDKPWLNISNLKVRHLQGISLRNLTVKKPSRLSHGKSVDDEHLPTSLRSSESQFLLRERHNLTHSKSSSDIKASSSIVEKGDEHIIYSATESAISAEVIEDTDSFSPTLRRFKHERYRPTDDEDSSLGNSLNRQESLTSLQSSQTDGAAISRPSRATLRRTSTLNWSNTTSMTRQRKLEEVVEAKMLDTFFTIHVSFYAEPLYISEVIQKSVNADFIFFDLEVWGPRVTRTAEFVTRVWAKPEGKTDFSVLLEYKVHMGSLEFLCKSLENYRQPLPENCVLFHMTDGIYGNFTGLARELPASLPIFNGVLKSRGSKSRSSSPSTQPTSSAEALMKLKNLDECIQDALSTRNTLVKQIQGVLDENESVTDTVAAATTAQSSLIGTRAAVSLTKKQIAKAKGQNAQLRASIASRRSALQSGNKAQKESLEYLKRAQHTLETRLSEAQAAEHNISGHIRRICEDLVHIFPLEPIPGKPLCFTILDNYLPNADFSSPLASEPATAAALGYVATILCQLSSYLSIALPYPLKPLGSVSTVSDPISLHVAKTSTEYPLFQTGSVAYRFEYGVFLLNKDLETLMVGKGVRLLDLRNTLPNLKYLLGVLGGGGEGVPGRKIGGVRGLSLRGTGRLEVEERIGIMAKASKNGDIMEQDDVLGFGGQVKTTDTQENGEVSKGGIDRLGTRALADTSHGSGFASRTMARKWLETVK